MPTIRIRLLASLLLLVVLESHALTLGRLRGAAIIGQGLDVSIQVQTDPEEGPSNLCFEADVFHADARQEPARVVVSAEPAQTPQTLNVRIRSSAVIDEPVVTVYLRAGCNQKISRRYVMLADVLSEPAAPAAVATAAQVPLVTPVPSPPAASGASAGGDASPSGMARPASGASPQAAAPSATPSPRPAPKALPRPEAAVRKPSPRKAAPTVAPSSPAAPAASEKLAAGRSAGQSRLKLDPLEVLSERVAILESSTASAPAEQAAREVRDAQRLQALEASVKNLLAVATRNEASLAELRVRLQQAESDRYANPLVYGLLALLALCLAGIVFLLTRRGGTGGGARNNWWSGGADAPDVAEPPPRAATTAQHSSLAPLSEPAPLSGPGSLPGVIQTQYPTQQQTYTGGPASRAAPATQVDVSLVEMSESTFDRLMQSGTTHSAVRRHRATEPVDLREPIAEPGRRLINSDELFDVRQQADFFVSLGQTDQAVRVLENRIAESGESSPVAYLDLLKIFHSLGLRADYRQVREDFNLLFNARLPEFANFDNEGRSLEAYPEILTAIQKDWASPEVLRTIETFVFRDQWGAEHEPLDLAAFRDLLLLHAVAHSAGTLTDEMVVASVPAPQRTPYSTSAMQPMSPSRPPPATEAALSAAAPLVVDVPLPSLDSGAEVDIDLSDVAFDLTLPDTSMAPPAIANTDHGNLIDFDLPPLPDVDQGPKGRT